MSTYFNDTQRQATKDARNVEGLDVFKNNKQTNNGCISTRIRLKKDAKLVAVYDLDGGTFDISILELEDEVFEVKSTNSVIFCKLKIFKKY